MKSKSFLDWLLITSLLLSVVFSVKFLIATRSLREAQTKLQADMSKYQATRTMLNMLVADAVEYSKRNPEIKPILESVGVGKAAPAPAPKPAAK